MALFQSKGYFHLTGINHTKHRTSEKEVLTLPDEYAQKIYIPAVEPMKGLPLTLKASVGDEVKAGTLIATRTMLGHEIPVYATCSGRISGEEMAFHGGLGRPVKHLVIENDFRYESVPVHEPVTPDSDPETIVDAMAKFGCVGMGGAGFPTFIKYKGVKNVDTLIINGVECEPFLTTDYQAMIEEVDDLLYGVALMMKASGAMKAYICFKKNKTAVFDALKQRIDPSSGIEIRRVKDVYPMGWERLLIRSVTGRTYDKLPSEAHVIVNNVQTAIELAKSARSGCIATHTRITVSGEGVKENANVIVPIGARVSEIIRFMNGYTVEEGVVLLGGPMCSKGLMNDTAAITANVNALTVLKKVVRTPQQCLRCGACTDHCPANIQPVEVKLAVETKNTERMLELNPTACIGCGLCSYICPSFIEVNDFVKKAKMLVTIEQTKRAAAAAKANAGKTAQGGK